MTARDKAKLLGLLFGIYTVLSLLIIAIIGIVYVGIFGVIFSSVPTKPGDPPPEVILPIIIAIFAIVFIVTLIFCIPEIVAAYGLRKEKPWAKVWTIIASILACMSFPFGTAVGIFGLVFTFSDEGKAYFDEITAKHQIGGNADRAFAPPQSEWR